MVTCNCITDDESMTNDEIGERGRLARCVTRLAGRYRESFSAGRRKERARRPRSPTSIFWRHSSSLRPAVAGLRLGRRLPAFAALGRGVRSE
jgi:hypothetical protein